MRTTYTYALLEVSQAAFDEVRAKLLEAGDPYPSLIDETADGPVIDMHGLALVVAKPRPPEPQPTSSGSDPTASEPRPESTEVGRVVLGGVVMTPTEALLATHTFCGDLAYDDRGRPQSCCEEKGHEAAGLPHRKGILRWKDGELARSPLGHAYTPHPVYFGRDECDYKVNDGGENDRARLCGRPAREH